MSFTASDASKHHADLSESQQQRWAEVAEQVESVVAACGVPAADAERIANEAADAWLQQAAVVVPFPQRVREDSSLNGATADGSDSHLDSHVERLLEYTTSQGVRPVVDRRQGIIRGVKVLGLASRNGRVYQMEAITAAAGLYEGVKVNLNHPKAHLLGPRDYQDRLGSLRQVCASDSGLFGDLHFNPKHPVAEQLVWDAEHAPENLGLSHNVEARTSRRGGKTVIEAILKVNSVDLVADPATTTSLFEGIDGHLAPEPFSTSHAHRQQVARLLEALSLNAATTSPAWAARLAHLDEETLTLLTEHLRQQAHQRPQTFPPVSLPKSKGPQPRLAITPDIRHWARSIT